MRQLEMQTPVIVFSMHADPSNVGRVLSQGVKGYLLKDEALEQLVKSIHVVHSGGEYFSNRITISSEHNTSRKKNEDKDGLTDKEIEIVSLIANGLSSSEIAGKLGRSIKTIESHRANVFKKIGVNNVANLTRYAIRKGYISP